MSPPDGPELSPAWRSAADCLRERKTRFELATPSLAPGSGSQEPLIAPHQFSFWKRLQQASWVVNQNTSSTVRNADNGRHNSTIERWYVASREYELAKLFRLYRRKLKIFPKVFQPQESWFAGGT